MEKFTNTITKKLLIIIITIVMLTNFIMPNYVQAKDTVGESLVKGISYLLAWFGDIGIKTMQDIMIGDKEIKEGNNYSIKYSPGIIFSNKVLGLDINFINPNTNVINVKEREAKTITIFSKEYEYDATQNRCIWKK